MKVLLVTEKYEPENSKRDGGSRIVKTLKNSLGDKLSIMQFGSCYNSEVDWNFSYPSILSNRFEQRIANARFIAEEIKKIEDEFTHIIFIHISMQFGIIDVKLKNDIIIWTFPMFLAPSYELSGETISEKYKNLEKLALTRSDKVITPSYFEKEQLISYYLVPDHKIHVIPRGIDTSLLVSNVRNISKNLKICSIGSIKPQKNTLGLIDLFAKILKEIPSAELKIIGAIQNEEYYIEVCDKIQKLDINNNIEFIDYLPPDQLFESVRECHIHISRSNCETFGRSIFETLACGIPNVAKKTGNAAAEFLYDKPYAKFIDNDDEAAIAVFEILKTLPYLSLMASEVKKLYDDQILSRLIPAIIFAKEAIAISDFDGTLFHKKDEYRTLQSINEFKKYGLKVICSARSNEDLLEQLKIHNLEVDWIIAFSGAVVTDGKGNIIFSVPIDLDSQKEDEIFTKEAKKLEVYGTKLQIAVPENLLPHDSIINKHNLRYEIYENIAYIANIEASKLHAIHKLLKHIDWEGRVKVFGDGRYDMEMINYFDGVKINA